MSEPPLLDRGVFDEMIGLLGDEAGASVIDLFQTEIDGFIAMMRNAAATPGDRELREQVRRNAHALKSSAGQIGAAALADAARRVEQAAQDGDPLDAPIAALLRCAAATEQALASALAGGQA
ncbi:MAG: Hpt domain-containing protein [Alphaproteobacteria bacterium]|nr:Hpt domain-containing protein [Alphaproteobacteria bacterium]